jgi:hypothetical protein
MTARPTIVFYQHQIAGLNRCKLEPKRLDEMCQECDRLWREHSELTNLRLEPRLRRAELRQDDDLVKALAEKLTYLA